MLRELHDVVNRLIVRLKDNMGLNTKKVSDKYHTFGDLYKQRVYLFSVICNQNKDKAWKSKKHFDEENDPMFNGDFIVGIETPKGHFSFHFKLEFWDMFSEIQELERAPKYDGYNQDEGLDRLISLVYEDSKRKYKA